MGSVRDGGGLSPVWLVSNGTVLSSANLATSRRDRRRGLIGVSDVHVPLVLRPCNWVHTVGVRAPLDVAWVAADGTVLATGRLAPMRVGPMHRRAAFVVEAAAGSFDRWGLRAGDTVEVRATAVA
ncbi:MAG: DUF192 domain-containing protein [Actinomycetota bacterium]